ncbi:Heme-binding protein 2-like [Arapaima gigas]
MKPQLVVLCIFIIPVASCAAEQWSAPPFCHGYPCPEYKLIQDHGAFQERLYKRSLWAETPVQSTAYSDVADGFGRIFKFTGGDNEAGQCETLPTTIPTAVFYLESDYGTGNVSTAVFMPPNGKVPKPTDASVKLVERASATVFVRVFDGLPTESNALSNVQQLRNDLGDAGKRFDPCCFVGAGYESLLTLIGRHNEVWVFADSDSDTDYLGNENSQSSE